MPDIKLFSIQNVVKEVSSTPAVLERELQILIEHNMSVFFGITFLESEYTTSNGSRIDSLGIDENDCPVIFEYKRSSNENVINQGLFYLDWLMDHKAEFELLVMRRLGKERSDRLDWTIPRLICIAGNFTKYDEHAVNQINRNIDLVRYILYGKDHILFEFINPRVEAVRMKPSAEAETKEKRHKDRTFEEQYAAADTAVKSLYSSIKDFILSLSDDITENELKLYTAFRKIRNIICAEIKARHVVLYLKLDPETVSLEKGFTRDLRNVGHWGTGDLEVIIRDSGNFEKAKPLIERAYQEN